MVFPKSVRKGCCLWDLLELFPVGDGDGWSMAPMYWWTSGLSHAKGDHCRARLKVSSYDLQELLFVCVSMPLTISRYLKKGATSVVLCCRYTAPYICIADNHWCISFTLRTGWFRGRTSRSLSLSSSALGSSSKYRSIYSRFMILARSFLIEWPQAVHRMLL